MMADTDEKINEYIEKSLNYLSAIGRPIDLKYEQRISIQHLFLGKDVISSSVASPTSPAMQISKYYHYSFL